MRHGFLKKKDEFPNPISQLDFVGVSWDFVGCSWRRGSRVRRWPRGGAEDKRYRISFGLRGLRGICIPSTRSLSNFFCWKSFYLFIFLSEVFRAQTCALIVPIPCFANLALRVLVC